MAEDQRNRKTVFVGNISEDTDQQAIFSAFNFFGDILDIQIPADPVKKSRHRGFGFVEFTSTEDALDAIDNMNFNELNGRILKVNMARPMKGQQAAGSNRAVWDNEEWIKQHAKPLGQSSIEEEGAEGGGDRGVQGGSMQVDGDGEGEGGNDEAER